MLRPAAPMLAEPLLLTSLTYALGLGLRHAFDSDHVAAITTLVTEGHPPRHAAIVGASWGLGHALAVVGVGAVLVALGVHVPPGLAVALELVVVAMLLLLGLRAFSARPAAAASVSRSGYHGHPHAHEHEPGERGLASFGRLSPRRWSVRALGVGLVHGASGTAALALLALSSLPSRAHGVVFLLTFAAGATLSMTALSYLLALPLAAASRRSRRSGSVARVVAGAASFAAAAALLIEQLRAAL